MVRIIKVIHRKFALKYSFVIFNFIGNHIELVQKWQWNGKECIITATVLIYFSKYKHTMSTIMTYCI